jgi:outer membrane protein, multidrug efflux system
MAQLLMKHILPLIAAMLLLAGCTLDPQMGKSRLPVSASFLGGSSSTTAAADIPWRKFFVEPRLRKLIELSLANNRDLRIAALNVEKSRAQFVVTASASLPDISAQSSFTREKSNGTIRENWRTSLGFTAYELDFFGRIRSQNREALETFLATNEAQRSAKISLIAEVASRYYAIRLAEEQAALARKTLESVQASYQLNKARADAGETNQLDLRSAESQVQYARINLLSYERDIARGHNALTLLLGCPMPADLPTPRDYASTALLANVSSGLPSALILHRPDILQAEHQLLAANANIGAARAAFFPSISLTGSLGNSSTHLSQLFRGSSATWSFAPQITVPIFNAGRNRANLAAAESSRKIELANYEKSIQTAFREVADSLADANTYREQIPIATELVKTQSARFDLATERYQQGESPYLEVLTAQQELFNAQLNLLGTQYNNLNAHITLYKSLGGGWK